MWKISTKCSAITRRLTPTPSPTSASEHNSQPYSCSPPSPALNPPRTCGSPTVTSNSSSYATLRAKNLTCASGCAYGRPSHSRSANEREWRKHFPPFGARDLTRDRKIYAFFLDDSPQFCTISHIIALTYDDQVFRPTAITLTEEENPSSDHPSRDPVARGPRRVEHSSNSVARGEERQTRFSCDQPVRRERALYIPQLFVVFAVPEVGETLGKRDGIQPSSHHILPPSCDG